MWGLIFRIAGPRLQSSVPGFLTSAGASHILTDYMERCVMELGREPDRYGFDPGSTYTVLVQTWDCAMSPARSLAFGRRRIGQEAVGLIPDFYFLSGRGYAGLRWAAQASPPWAARDATVVWRGSVTGRGPYDGPADVPRIALTLRARSLAGLDVKLTGVHDTMHSVLPLDELAAFVQAEALLGDVWAMPHFGDFKYVIDIDGHANAWGLLEKLILGCCVLKVESPYEQWFYGRLRPWVHYVPISPDLSDLEERISWCREHEATCAWIAGNGSRLAGSLTEEAELERSCEQIMSAAQASPGWSTPRAPLG